MPARDFPLDLATVPVDQWVGLGQSNLWRFQRLANQGVNRGHCYFSTLFKAQADDEVDSGWGCSRTDPGGGGEL